MLRGRQAVAFASSVSSGAASSRCLMGWEGGCRRFCHFSGGPLQQPARRSAGVPPGRTPVGAQCAQGSFVTGGGMATSHRSSVMFSTGCQSHSASSTSSAYSSFFHFTELLQSSCAISAPELIPPRLDYGYDHWRELISACRG